MIWKVSNKLNYYSS